MPEKEMCIPSASAASLCVFFSKDADGIGTRFTGMDYQRLAAGPRRPDVHAETFTLPFGVALAPVVIQAGFANRHAFRVCGQRQQALKGRLLATLLRWMHAYRKKYIRMCF